MKKYFRIRAVLNDDVKNEDFEMKHTKGFITVATGKEEYYQLAANLLRSYHLFCNNPLPFAILADQKNAYTDEFDDVIVFPDGASHSYLDKLSLGEYLPYDINIFIDSDCLAFGDLNQLFDYFEDANDFSCFGRVLPLNDKTGWFEYENLGKLQKKVSYVVGLHGGIYYMRKGDMCRKIFEDAKSFVPDYPKFKFKGRFNTPGDEPLVALSMAVNGCHPIPFVLEAICCYWEHLDHMTIDLSKGMARVEEEPKYNAVLVHWGTRYTRQLEYQKQIELMRIREEAGENQQKKIKKCKRHYGRLMTEEKIKKFVPRVKNKLKRTIGIQ